MGRFIQVNSQGSNLRAYYAEAKGGKGPGVLLCHAWWGVNEFFTGLADRLAEEGFTVLAPDLYDGQIASTIPEAETLVTAFEEDGGEKGIAKEQAGLDYLLSSPNVQGARIGAIGFSMGANYVTWLATLRPEVAAVVVFYGASDWNSDYHENASAPLQGHWASNDQFEASEDAVQVFEARMKAAGHTPDFYTYPNTEHWFFESDRPEYNPEASQLAWERTLAFLHEHCG
ncbi:MAG: dienelactone hydrolase family protein [Chloroflexota bacterium]